MSSALINATIGLAGSTTAGVSATAIYLNSGNSKPIASLIEEGKRLLKKEDSGDKWTPLWTKFQQEKTTAPQDTLKIWNLTIR